MTMTDFGHLKSQRKDTAEFTFWDIDTGEKPPFTLICRFAGESNKQYFNEVLRRADHYAKRKAKINAEMIKDNRDRDRDLFPKYVIVGWKNVVDKNGVDVSFNEENLRSFLNALDDEMFDGLREFCKEAANFRESVNAVAASGNLPTA